jgi:hypothetical protein
MNNTAGGKSPIHRPFSNIFSYSRQTNLPSQDRVTRRHGSRKDLYFYQVCNQSNYALIWSQIFVQYEIFFIYKFFCQIIDMLTENSLTLTRQPLVDVS